MSAILNFLFALVAFGLLVLDLALMGLMIADLGRGGPR